VAVVFTFKDQGKIGQAILFTYTVINTVFILGIYGFVVMAEASPFLRNIAVAQWLSMLSCIIAVLTIDIFLFRKAEHMGAIRWGKMSAVSQYVLLTLFIVALLTMGIMGFIRSGLRENWHVYGVLQDTSEWAFTPTNLYAAKVIAFCALTFIIMMTIAFWLSELGEKKKVVTTSNS